MFASILLLAAAQFLQPFQFRDWHAGDQYRRDDPRFSRCVATGVGQTCLFADRIFAGVTANQIGASFGRNGLFVLEVKFPSTQQAVIEAALMKRYGAPCEARTEKLTAFVGGTVERRVKVWCFREGRATFQSVYNQIDEGGFIFNASDAAVQAAVADF